ncbi:MAG: hypothetical protein AVDCRST_MAG70-1772, partial [uncultured Thermomicrobiales bacterium]
GGRWHVPDPLYPGRLRRQSASTGLAHHARRLLRRTRCHRRPRCGDGTLPDRHLRHPAGGRRDAGARLQARQDRGGVRTSRERDRRGRARRGL